MICSLSYSPVPQSYIRRKTLSLLSILIGVCSGTVVHGQTLQLTSQNEETGNINITVKLTGKKESIITNTSFDKLTSKSGQQTKPAMMAANNFGLPDFKSWQDWAESVINMSFPPGATESEKRQHLKILIRQKNKLGDTLPTTLLVTLLFNPEENVWQLLVKDAWGNQNRAWLTQSVPVLSFRRDSLVWEKENVINYGGQGTLADVTPRTLIPLVLSEPGCASAVDQNCLAQLASTSRRHLLHIPDPESQKLRLTRNASRINATAANTNSRENDTHKGLTITLWTLTGFFGAILVPAIVCAYKKFCSATAPDQEVLRNRARERENQGRIGHFAVSGGCAHHGLDAISCERPAETANTDGGESDVLFYPMRTFVTRWPCNSVRTDNQPYTDSAPTCRPSFPSNDPPRPNYPPPPAPPPASPSSRTSHTPSSDSDCSKQTEC